MYTFGGKNVIGNYRVTKQNKEIKIFRDQFTSPTYVPNLSKMIIETIQKNLKGIIHLAGSKASRLEVAKLVSKKAYLNSRLLKPINLDEMSFDAKRPKDSSLDVSKASSILDEKPMNIDLGVEYFLQDVAGVK